MKNLKIPPDVIYKNRLKKSFKKNKSCAVCNYKGLLTIDHIIKKEYYPNENDSKNWQVLCERCHIKKTRLENWILDGQIDRIKLEDYININGLLEALEIYYHNIYEDFLVF